MSHSPNSVSNPEFIEEVLYDRASLYSAQHDSKRRLVERTILIAASDPAFFAQSDVEHELFKIMHRVAQEECGIHRVQAASANTNKSITR